MAKAFLRKEEERDPPILYSFPGESLSISFTQVMLLKAGTLVSNLLFLSLLLLLLCGS